MKLNFIVGRLGALLAALLLFSSVAQAQVKRNYTPRQTYEVRGDIVLTGNRNLEPTSATASRNNNQATAYIDVDNDGSTLNSSSAVLKLPAGVSPSDILYARLYWVGRIQPAPTNPSVKMSVTGLASGYQVVDSTSSGASPTGNDTSKVFQFDVFKSGNDIDVYIASADVTAQVKGATGNTPSILVGGIAASNSTGTDPLAQQGALAGWSLVTVYRQSSSLIRQLRIFDGASKVNSSTSVNTSITGFRTPDQTAYEVRFGAVAFEGDFDILGDRFRLNGTDLSNAVNPADNFFNSSVSQNDQLFTAAELNPALRNGNNTFGVDVDRLTLPNQGPTSTFFPFATKTANLQFTSTSDEYYPVAFTTSIPSFEISGRVFEDINYGGGPGRAPTSPSPDATPIAGAAPVPGARVEIYNANTGAFVAATTTDETGTYYFYQLGPGRFRVRVVNSLVASTRPGSVAGLVPVQTYRTNATTGIDSNGSATPTPVTNRVGGENPALLDATPNTTGANYATLNTATNAVQSPTDVILGNDPVVGVNFAFNFDTVVNTRDAGQGSLRQFVFNSNALANAGLAQEGQTAGVETSIFMIPSASDPLGRAKDPNFNSGVAKITLASPIVVTGANANATAIDGRTQTANIGDTNTGTFGSGGTVGVNNLALPTVPRPEVEITGPNSVAIGLDIAAGDAVVRNLSVWGFGATGNSSDNASIRVRAGATASQFTQLAQLTLGAPALGDTGSAPLNPANYGKGDLVQVTGVALGNLSNSILAWGGGKGITLQNGANRWTLQSNEIRNNARDNANWDGIDAQVQSTNIIQNLIYNQGGNGVDSLNAPGQNLVGNNTIRNNGLLGTQAAGESAGVRVFGTDNIVGNNIIRDNYGAGVQVQPGATTTISLNSIFGNGDIASSAGAAPSRQIGIDLLSASGNAGNGTSPYVTPNASGNKGAGGNDLVNFPILTGAVLSGGQLTLEGFAPAGATLEFFVAAPDPSGFGEGQSFAFSFVEGSTSDTDATTGAYNAASLQASGYPASVAALAGSETAARRFRFVTAPGAISSTSLITATATVVNVTSEFSPVLAPNNAGVRGTVYLDANRNATLDNGESGAGLNGLFVKAVLQGQNVAAQAVAVDAATGAFLFNGLSPGTYTLVLDDNNNLNDITPAIPPGYVGTQSPNGTRGLTLGTQPIGAQNFGLFRGAQITGTVYEDNGIGTGTANDGVRNGTEVGLAGVKLNLTRQDGSVIDSTTTDASGNFGFRVPDSLASTPLRIVEINPTDYVSTGAQIGNTAGTYDRQTDAISFGYTAGATYSGLSFGDVRGATLAGEDAKTGTIGSSVSYMHVFTAQTAGSVVFDVNQLPSPANPDWSVVAFRDSNGNGELDGADAQLGSAPIEVVAGQEITVFLQNFVPTTAANGAQDKLTIGATFTASGANAPPVQVLTRSDLTTVAANQGLVLTKVVDKATAKSGDVLLYTITYRNTGADVLTNLVVSDATPAYTSFVSAADGARPMGLTTPVIAAPAAGGKGAVSWTFGGGLNPGQSGTVTFRVRVD